MKENNFAFHLPKQSINLKEHRKTVSTLRIPIGLKKTFQKGIQKNGNLSKYLTYLLKKYRFLIYTNKIPFSQNVKTEYQERGTRVFIKTFRPELKDWLELGIWASALNYSCCKLFVMLLECEHQERLILNKKAFLRVIALVNTVFRFKTPRLVKVLLKGRSILERKVNFYEHEEPF